MTTLNGGNRGHVEHVHIKLFPLMYSPIDKLGDSGTFSNLIDLFLFS